MATITLRVSIYDQNCIKVLQFDTGIAVVDACRVIRERLIECRSNESQHAVYGLFVPDAEDNEKGFWMESGRSLSYYMLRDEDIIQYRNKFRQLRVRTLDESVKTLLVDDSALVRNLMVTICTKMGIIMHEEYSLIHEKAEDTYETVHSHSHTLTLKRSKKFDDKTLDPKMATLRRKLKTEDESLWIDHNKTLREQGIDEKTTLLLKRKFFFSDRNIDSRDPVQLTLVYVQARDAILKGTHPVNEANVCQFAGIQCQIQFGNYQESKHRTGFFELADFVPQYFVKVKGIERKINIEHRKYIGLSESEAKIKYIQIARALSTYGVSFYLVKEKLKGRNKLVPRLLGVSKEAVLRLDEKTKEILKQWPLTTVRRWAASPNTFTLDFGDYSDQYYSVQTTEGEQIAQLIAGYIDIILKKQQTKDWFGYDKESDAVMIEESVSPNRAAIIQQGHTKITKFEEECFSNRGIIPDHHSTMFSSNDENGLKFTKDTNNISNTHPCILDCLSKPERALINTINVGQEAIDIAKKDLNTKIDSFELGSDLSSLKWKQTAYDSNRQNVSAQLASMNAATAQVVSLTSGVQDEIDHYAVDAAISSITHNIPTMTKGVRTLAALSDNPMHGNNLLDAAKTLCDAFGGLLEVVQPGTDYDHQNVWHAASCIGQASGDMLCKVEDENIDTQQQDVLLGLAKSVANATAGLILTSKNVASVCDNEHQQNLVFSAATQCALSTSQLVAVSKVVGLTLFDVGCQNQIFDACAEVSRAVQLVAEECNNCCRDQHLLNALQQAANDVANSLYDLEQFIKFGSDEDEDYVDTIITVSDKLLANQSDPMNMINQARILAQATAQLIQCIKSQAEGSEDIEYKQRLLKAAKQLAEATAQMMSSAKVFSNDINDLSEKENLLKAAHGVREASNLAASDILRRRMIRKLQDIAKTAASCGTQCITAAQNASAHNVNHDTQDELMSSCKSVANLIPILVRRIKESLADCDSNISQSELLQACKKFIPPSTCMIENIQKSLPTVKHDVFALQLNNNSKQFASCLANMQTVIARLQEVGGFMEIDVAIDSVYKLKNDLSEFIQAASKGNLKSLPGESSETATYNFSNSKKMVASTISQLMTFASERNEEYCSEAIRQVDNALTDFIDSVRAVAATSNIKILQENILVSSMNVLDSSIILMKDVKYVVSDNDSYNQTRLHDAAKSVSDSLADVLNNLPGYVEVNKVMDHIKQNMHLDYNQAQSVNIPYEQLKMNLNHATTAFSDSCSHLSQAAKVSLTSLATSVSDFNSNYDDTIDASIKILSTINEPDLCEKVVQSLHSLNESSCRLLNAAKNVSIDQNNISAKNNLINATKDVLDTINNLIDNCIVSSPGQQECDNAIRMIQNASNLFKDCTEPINISTYFDCLEKVMDESVILGEGMTGMANYTRSPDNDKFSKAVNDVANSICGLIESAFQVNYLIGVSDPTSLAGRSGLIDQNQLFESKEAILASCLSLRNSNIDRKQILNAATIIAKHTSLVCNACRNASVKTSNAIARRHFVQSAKEVAKATASLVKNIKLLDMEYNSLNQQRCSDSTKILIDSVDSLCNFASSPEFASSPAKISAQARENQKPIKEASLNIINGSCSLISVAKNLSLNSKDPISWQALASHSKEVSDSIKQLVCAIRDNAPGQKECDECLTKVENLFREFDQARMAVANQSLEVSKDDSLEGYSDRVCNTTNQIITAIDSVCDASKHEAENIGHTVNTLISFYDSLAPSIIGLISHMVNTNQKMILLDQAKTLVESVILFLQCVKQSGGNPKAIQCHTDVDSAANSLKEVVNEFLVNVKNHSASSGIVNGVIESINAAMTQQGNLDGWNEYSFVDYQTRMVQLANDLSHLSQEIVYKCTSEPLALCMIGSKLGDVYCELASNSRGAVMVSNNSEGSNRLHTSMQVLGQACISMVKSTAICHTGTADIQGVQQRLSECNKCLQDKVVQVLSALQSGSKGTQACINAASAVSGIVGDLDTTIMFAKAGTFPLDSESVYSDHVPKILKTAKALVEDTKTLVAGAASTQEQLASAADNTVNTMILLAQVIKQSAATLGSNKHESQVMLMNSIRDVASALGDLIHSTKVASGKSPNDPAMQNLKDSAKTMVSNVTSLLKIVKCVEDDHNQGANALKSTIEFLSQELDSYSNNLNTNFSSETISAEEFTAIIRPITTITATAVAVSNTSNQDDALSLSNTARKVIVDLLHGCYRACKVAETDTLRKSIKNCGQFVVSEYVDLLAYVHRVLIKPSEKKQAVTSTSRQIAQHVTELVNYAQELKGSDWVDAENPAVIAESELIDAANSIDLAAKKLSSLQPRRPSKELDQDMNFDELILESCQAIASATLTLVKAAHSAQQELVKMGLMAPQAYDEAEESQWSEGLISAARMVAVATRSLCQAANSLVQGNSSEEVLISAAKQVAGSTAQLIVACKVKADPDSRSTQRLQDAGNKVKRATDNLVVSAQKAIERQDDRSVILNTRLVGGLAQEMDAQSEILRKERELEEARNRLTALRKAKYDPDTSDTTHTLIQRSVTSVRPETTKSSDHQHLTPSLSLKPNISSKQPSHIVPLKQDSVKSLKKSHETIVDRVSRNMGKVNLTDHKSVAEKPDHRTEESQNTITEGPCFSESLKRFREAAGDSPSNQNRFAKGYSRNK